MTIEQQKAKVIADKKKFNEQRQRANTNPANSTIKSVSSIGKEKKPVETESEVSHADAMKNKNIKKG